MSQVVTVVNNAGNLGQQVVSVPKANFLGLIGFDAKRLIIPAA